MKNHDSLSKRIYGWLLRFYPERFREEFGTEMERLFGDQYNEARTNGARDLGSMWLRTLGDFTASVIHEHIQNLRGNMSIHSMRQFCGRELTFGRLFLGIGFTLVALCVVMTVYVLPKAYISTARLSVATARAEAFDPYHVQTAFEKIKSQQVLNPVIDEMNLGAVLAKQMGLPGELNSTETYTVLLSMIMLRQSRNTSVVDIQVVSEDPGLSARIANKIAEVAARASGALIIDAATPPMRPARPNVPLNITLGALVSLIAAVVFAAMARLMARGLAGSA